MTGFGKTLPQAVTMKIEIGAVLLAAAAFLAGCSGFWNLPPSTTTPTATGVFYVLNQTADQIVAYSISSGTLTEIGTLTPPTPTPTAIAVAPNGRFLYVSTSGGIYLYSISSNGALTLGNGGSSISPDQAQTMQVDATNQWLVEAVSGSSQLSAIAINSSTGALASTSETAQQFSGGLPATTPIQLAISPNDSSSCTDCYVFVAMGSGGTEAIHFNPSSSNPFGSAGRIGLVNSSGGDTAVAMDPTNRLLYVAETEALPSAAQTGGLRVFTIASGAVTELPGGISPYAIGGAGPSAILPSSNGDYVFVANRSVSGSSSANITGFSVSSTSSSTSLTSIGTVTDGPSGQMGLAEDSTGTYVLAVDFAGNPDLDIYTMSSGALTSAITSPTGTDPVGAVAIAALP
jgi:DNA-binding beta-propeller fold protein YncE